MELQLEQIGVTYLALGHFFGAGLRWWEEAFLDALMSIFLNATLAPSHSDDLSHLRLNLLWSPHV